MELSVFQIIWIISGSVLATGWLIVSFTSPSRNRTIIEWMSTTAMFVAILTIFVKLTLSAHDSGHVFAMWAIGVLCLLFGGGLLVSTWKTVAALGAEKKSESSATN